LKKRVLHSIAIFLVTALLTPSVVKLADAFLHEHNHVYCISKTEKHYHQHNEECAITAISFSSFVEGKSEVLENQLQEFSLRAPNFYQSFTNFGATKTQQLRAPPVLIS